MFGSVVAQGQRGMRKTVASREQGARSKEQGAEIRNAEVSTPLRLKRPATRRFAQSLERRKDKADGREKKNFRRASGPLGGGIGSRFYRSVRGILAEQLSAASAGRRTTRSNSGVD